MCDYGVSCLGKNPGVAFFHCIHLDKLLKLSFSEIIIIPTVWRTFWRLNEWMDIKNLEQWLVIIKYRINLLLMLSIQRNLRGSLCWVRLLVSFWSWSRYGLRTHWLISWFEAPMWIVWNCDHQSCCSHLATTRKLRELPGINQHHQ